MSFIVNARNLPSVIVGEGLGKDGEGFKAKDLGDFKTANPKMYAMLNLLGLACTVGGKTIYLDSTTRRNLKEFLKNNDQEVPTGTFTLAALKNFMHGKLTTKIKETDIVIDKELFEAVIRKVSTADSKALKTLENKLNVTGNTVNTSHDNLLRALKDSGITIKATDRRYKEFAAELSKQIKEIKPIAATKTPEGEAASDGVTSKPTHTTAHYTEDKRKFNPVSEEPASKQLSPKTRGPEESQEALDQTQTYIAGALQVIPDSGLSPKATERAIEVLGNLQDKAQSLAPTAKNVQAVANELKQVLDAAEKQVGADKAGKISKTPAPSAKQERAQVLEARKQLLGEFMKTPAWTQLASSMPSVSRTGVRWAEGKDQNTLLALHASKNDTYAQIRDEHKTLTSLIDEGLSRAGLTTISQVEEGKMPTDWPEGLRTAYQKYGTQRLELGRALRESTRAPEARQTLVSQIGEGAKSAAATATAKLTDLRNAKNGLNGLIAALKEMPRNPASDGWFLNASRPWDLLESSEQARLISLANQENLGLNQFAANFDEAYAIIELALDLAGYDSIQAATMGYRVNWTSEFSRAFNKMMDAIQVLKPTSEVPTLNDALKDQRKKMLNLVEAFKNLPEGPRLWKEFGRRLKPWDTLGSMFPFVAGRDQKTLNNIDHTVTTPGALQLDHDKVMAVLDEGLSRAGYDNLQSGLEDTRNNWSTSFAKAYREYESSRNRVSKLLSSNISQREQELVQERQKELESLKKGTVAKMPIKLATKQELVKKYEALKEAVLNDPVVKKSLSQGLGAIGRKTGLSEYSTLEKLAKVNVSTLSLPELMQHNQQFLSLIEKAYVQSDLKAVPANIDALLKAYDESLSKHTDALAELSGEAAPAKIAFTKQKEARTKEKAYSTKLETLAAERKDELASMIGKGGVSERGAKLEPELAKSKYRMEKAKQTAHDANININGEEAARLNASDTRKAIRGRLNGLIEVLRKNPDFAGRIAQGSSRILSSRDDAFVKNIKAIEDIIANRLEGVKFDPRLAEHLIFGTDEEAKIGDKKYAKLAGNLQDLIQQVFGDEKWPNEIHDYLDDLKVLLDHYKTIGKTERK